MSHESPQEAVADEPLSGGLGDIEVQLSGTSELARTAIYNNPPIVEVSSFSVSPPNRDLPTPAPALSVDVEQLATPRADSHAVLLKILTIVERLDERVSYLERRADDSTHSLPHPGSLHKHDTNPGLGAAPNGAYASMTFNRRRYGAGGTTPKGGGARFAGIVAERVLGNTHCESEPSTPSADTTSPTSPAVKLKKTAFGSLAAKVMQQQSRDRSSNSPPEQPNQPSGAERLRRGSGVLRSTTQDDMHLDAVLSNVPMQNSPMENPLTAPQQPGTKHSPSPADGARSRGDSVSSSNCGTPDQSARPREKGEGTGSFSKDALGNSFEGVHHVGSTSSFGNRQRSVVLGDDGKLQETPISTRKRRRSTAVVALREEAAHPFVSWITKGWIVDVFDALYIVSSIITAVLLLYEITLNVAYVRSEFHIAWFVFLQVTSMAWVIQKFHVRYLVGNWIVIDKIPDIRRHYGKGWFLYDIAYAFPFEFFGLISTNDWVFLGLCCKHFLRLYRMMTLTTSANPLNPDRASHRMLGLFGFMLLFYHVVTCVFANRMSMQYEDALYWATATLTTTGYGDLVIDEQWRVFSIISMLGGIFAMSGTTAYATTFLTTQDALASETADKKKRLQSMVNYYNIPWEVEKHVVAQFPSLIDADNKAAFMKFVEVLPPEVATTVEVYIRAKMMMAVPLLKVLNAHPGTMLTLARFLEHRFVPPYAYIIVAGDVGTELFFLAKGVVEVIVVNQEIDEETVVATLRPGMWFGEVALLEHSVRTASIQAVTACEVFSLSKANFDDLIASNEELHKSLQDELIRRRAAPK